VANDIMADGAPATTAGAGSLWNANSWHWESRNYNKWAEEDVRSKLQAFTASDAAAGLTVRVASLKELKVEATVNIRKGKKIPVFDISFTAVWDAQPSVAAAAGGAEPADAPKVSGEVKVIDLMPDDIEVRCN
jgi:activator of HSP90 ATPase